MMEAVKTYLVSVTAAAIVCSCILALTGKKGTLGAMTRLLTGIFMTYTILNPMIDINLGNLEYITEDILTEASDAVSAGKNMASIETKQLIKTNLEAYILDKASMLHAELTVDVQLDEEKGLVDSVVLKGKISPYAKEEMMNYLTNELGISREVQNWQD